ncbi:unnamed protein product, partial [Allacma fusca]
MESKTLSESTLLKIIEGPLRVAGVLGYEPLMIETGTLKLQNFSFKFVYHWLTLAAMLPLPIYIRLNAGTIQKVFGLISETEVLSHSLEGYATVFVCIFFKVYSLCRTNKTVKFWKENEKLFEEVNKLGFLNSDEQKQEMDKLRRRNRRSTNLFLISVLLFTIPAVGGTSWIMIRQNQGIGGIE